MFFLPSGQEPLTPHANRGIIDHPQRFFLTIMASLPPLMPRSQIPFGRVVQRVLPHLCSSYHIPLLHPTSLSFLGGRKCSCHERTPHFTRALLDASTGSTQRLSLISHHCWPSWFPTSNVGTTSTTSLPFAASSTFIAQAHLVSRTIPLVRLPYKCTISTINFRSIRTKRPVQMQYLHLHLSVRSSSLWSTPVEMDSWEIR